MFGPRVALYAGTIFWAWICVDGLWRLELILDSEVEQESIYIEWLKIRANQR